MRISAVIPTLDRPEFLRLAIQSVLRQTEPVDEIIVVNSGSPALVQEVLQGFEADVLHLSVAKSGPAAARNAGIHAANGKWVAFLDDDDLWLPEKIQSQMRALQACPDAVLAYTSGWIVGPEGSKNVYEAPDPESLWPMLRCRNGIIQSSVVARKDALLEAAGFDESLEACEDWDLWVRLRLGGGVHSCAGAAYCI